MNILKSKLLKKLVAIGLLALLFYVVDIHQLWAALSQLTFEIAFFLGIISVLLIYVSALKWKCFLEASGAQVSTLRLSALYLVGYFVNLLAPSYVGGDLVRSWYVGKKVGQHEALTATILERYTGLVAMVSLALVFMWSVERATVGIQITVFCVALGLVGLTVIALSERAVGIMERFRIFQPALKHVRKVQDGFRLAKKDKPLLVRTLLLSFIFHCSTVVNVIAAAYAVGWYDPPVWEIFVVLPLILLIGSIPIAPSGLGIQEGAFFYFLSSIGATPAEALGVGIVLRAKAYCLALIGGLVWLKIRNERQESGDLADGAAA